ncbi:MAG: hypothetical protein LC122_15550 [Chitinophagales bacterium]|nr:hypothetical protein [Chitinophagales bacterium]
MRLNKIYILLIITQLFILFGCEYYERNNPVDPGYKGVITKNLKVHSFYIYDPIGNNLPYSGGNGDSIINRGEKLKVFIKLINLGNSIESNINATAQLLTNSNIQITDSYLKYGDILPGQISEGDGDIYSGSGTYGRAFVELQIDKSVLPNTSFSLVLSYSDRADTLSLFCKPTGANIINDGVVVTYNLPSGNQYWFRPDYKIKNIGTSMTRLVKIIDYDSNDPNVSFGTSSSLEIGDLGVGESKSSGFFTPNIVVPNSLNFPYNTSVTIKLEDLFGNTWSLDYELTLEK